MATATGRRGWGNDAEPLHTRLGRTTAATGSRCQTDQAKRLGRPALAAEGKRLAAKLPKEAPRSSL